MLWRGCAQEDTCLLPDARTQEGDEGIRSIDKGTDRAFIMAEGKRMRDGCDGEHCLILEAAVQHTGGAGYTGNGRECAAHQDTSGKENGHA